MSALFTEAQVREMRRRIGISGSPGRLAQSFGTQAHTHTTADVSGLDAALANRAVLDDSNTHTGPLDIYEHVHANVQLSTDGAVAIEEGTIRASNLTAERDIELPDASGTLVLDAPSDGKYYVRKDGAWVEIIP